MNSMDVRKPSFIIRLLSHTWDHALDTNPINVRNVENSSAIPYVLGLVKIHIGEEYNEYTKCRKAFIHCSYTAVHVRNDSGGKLCIHIM